MSPIRRAGELTELGTVLGVWAHPDDETYLSGGLMAMAVANGQRVVTVSATAGDRGGDGDPWEVARVRRAELSAAMDALGVEEHFVLGYADGRCAAEPGLEPVEKLRALMEEVRPDTILTFGPDGFTGHPDHRAVGRWATQAWMATGMEARLLYVACPVGYDARWKEVHRRFDVFHPGLPVETPVDDMAVHLTLAGEVHVRKDAALRAHRSQTEGLRAAMGRDYGEWWRQESFVTAPYRLARSYAHILAA